MQSEAYLTEKKENKTRNRNQQWVKKNYVQIASNFDSTRSAGTCDTEHTF